MKTLPALVLGAFLLLQIPVYPLSEDEHAYLITLKMIITIFVDQQESKMERVKERKEGRWIYVDKKIKYIKKVPRSRTVTISEIFEAVTAAEARKNAIRKFTKLNYKNIKILTVKEIK